MDSSNNTYAMWDASTNRLGVGTTSPADFVHFKGATTTLPSNPTGTATATEVTGYEDPYQNDSNTNSYRVHTYKLVNGKVVISSTFLSCSYTDDGGGGSYYSVQISMSAAVPADATGYCIFRLNSGAPDLFSYLLTTSTTAIDQGVFTTTPAAQTSTYVSNFVLDTTRLQMLDSGGNQTFLLDGETGAFANLNVILQSGARHGLAIKMVAGQSADPLIIRNSSDAPVFRVSAGGFITTSAGISCTTGNFSGTMTILGSITSKRATFEGDSPSNEALALKLLAGQSQPIFVIRNASNIPQFSIAANGRDFVLDTTTGTKIGTLGTQKLGFWNATPVVQSTGWTTSNVTTDKVLNANSTTLDELADVVGTLIEQLKTYGLLGG
jgi:hypothetical protein